ncbi:MAG TPA: translation initiation factor IF-3 [Candidatus Sulfotelmatobacter sp.]|nr:translation initiation factor IF-3 [Candidatus Sulfotelmatobacter sp.]
MSRPFTPQRNQSAASFIRVNGKIRAREVRVIGPDSHQIGVLPLNDAINLARQQGVDLVEISPNAVPPVCRLVDFGKFRYELAKKEKESKKHQHASTVKEIQLSPRIDPHDLGIKLQHAINFLCEDMKVKVALKFKGREMAHTEIGFEVIHKFIADVAPYGHPDFTPKLIGKAINLMISPLPRNKRAKNPRSEEDQRRDEAPTEKAKPAGETVHVKKPKIEEVAAQPPAESFNNNPFAKLDASPRPES